MAMTCTLKNAKKNQKTLPIKKSIRNKRSIILYDFLKNEGKKMIEEKKHHYKYNPNIMLFCRKYKICNIYITNITKTNLYRRQRKNIMMIAS